MAHITAHASQSGTGRQKRDRTSGRHKKKIVSSVGGKSRLWGAAMRNKPNILNANVDATQRTCIRVILPREIILLRRGARRRASILQPPDIFRVSPPPSPLSVLFSLDPFTLSAGLHRVFVDRRWLWGNTGKWIDELLATGSRRCVFSDDYCDEFGNLVIYVYIFASYRFSYVVPLFCCFTFRSVNGWDGLLGGIWRGPRTMNILFGNIIEFV